VINRHLSCISHRFRDIASRSRKPPHPSLSTWSPPENLVFKRTLLTVESLSCFAVKTALSYLQLFCHSASTSHTTDDRQTTYHDNSRTLQWNWNVRLKTKSLYTLPATGGSWRQTNGNSSSQETVFHFLLATVIFTHGFRNASSASQKPTKSEATSNLHNLPKTSGKSPTK